jgi:hypothetical protein
MAITAFPSVAAQLASGLLQACSQLRRAPRAGARGIPVITGITLAGASLGSLENSQLEVLETLRESGVVFFFDRSVVMDHALGGERRLVVLAEGQSLSASAVSSVANLCLASDGNRQFPVPAAFLSPAFARDDLSSHLPTIIRYARRPVVTLDYEVLQPGWHEEAQTLVHGVSIDVPMFERRVGERALDRLPPRWRELLQGFPFESDVDLVNYLSLILTAILIDRFQDGQKPLAIFNGNQPGVGKTTLAQIVGVMADGQSPNLMTYTSDESEFTKRLSAGIRNPEQTVVVIDNARVAGNAAIGSVTLESQAISPRISLRELGQSRNIERNNDMLFLLTANGAQLNPDLATRSIAINLFLEGRADRRTFRGINPVDFASEHRAELLGEMMGLIIAWAAAGEQRANIGHRFPSWANLIGGILNFAGLSGFLTNTLSSPLDEQADQIRQLVMGLMRAPRDSVEGRFWVRADTPGLQTVGRGATATDWVTWLSQLQILQPSANSPPRGNLTQAGQFLSRQVNEVVEFDLDGEELSAVLRSASQRSRTRVYWFEVTARSGAQSGTS